MNLENRIKIESQMRGAVIRPMNVPEPLFMLHINSALDWYDANLGKKKFEPKDELKLRIITDWMMRKYEKVGYTSVYDTHRFDRL